MESLAQIEQSVAEQAAITKHLTTSSYKGANQIQMHEEADHSADNTERKRILRRKRKLKYIAQLRRKAARPFS
eukprot:10966584-Karenia_brevis.AAC.1